MSSAVSASPTIGKTILQRRAYCALKMVSKSVANCNIAEKVSGKQKVGQM
jgi:hypothetical protein